MQDEKIILYVEDDPFSLRLVKKILKHMPYHVLEAVDGESGVAIARQQRPDLIIMDLNLPDITGLEATARIKMDADLAHIPIIALTAGTLGFGAEYCIASGCDAYLTKPITKGVLLRTLQQVFTHI